MVSDGDCAEARRGKAAAKVPRKKCLRFIPDILVLLCYKSLSPLRILQGAGIVEGDGCCPSEDPDGRGYLSARAVGRDWQASYWSQLSRLGAVVLPPPVGPESRGPDPCAVLSVRWGE